MRVERGLTIDELAERLAISRQTIYYWVRDLPIEREPRWNPHVGAAAVKSKYQLRREAAYAQGLDEFDELVRLPTFRGNRVSYWVRYHADQDLAELAAFWSGQLGVGPGDIRLQRKSNSGQLAGRNWRSRHGVLTVLADDTLFRARLQAWIDRVKAEWVDLAAGA